MKNVYEFSGKFLKIVGIIIGLLVFFFNAFDYSPGYELERVMAFFGGLLGGLLVFAVLYIGGVLLSKLGKKNVPLKDSKQWPTSLKITGYIVGAIILIEIIFLIYIWIPCMVDFCDMLGESIFTIFFLCPLFCLAVIVFLATFIYQFHKNK